MNLTESEKQLLVAGDIAVRPFAWSDWPGLWEMRAEELAHDGIFLAPEQIPDGPKDVQRGDYEWDFHRMNEVYRSGAGNFWLAWWGDSPAGRVAAQDVGRFVELRRMYVRPQYRRRGIGTRLVKALIEHCAVRGVGRIELWTGKADLGRILYEKLGFREIGGRREDYEDVAAITLYRPKEDEIRMRLDLGDRKGESR